ncbi:MAG: 4Fe-4S binding protein [Planctomycetota bacterium]|nr:MAG: 4Fe-4S binding protein [Planctomycetota bacterium]
MPPPAPAIPLPVLQGQVDPCRPQRRSRMGRRRALVLLGVHALAAVHVAHWLSAGRSLTPLEPSEAMEFCKHGLVNAGALFFGLTILSTSLLGRWFCGWACHLVALQDLCRWLMLRAGITPRPLRSRLLRWVPALAFGYMFLWPLAYRAVRGDSLAPQALELSTPGFWASFPGVAVALLTFAVCGFAAVYFLGAKGFCTYACPYGAAFGAVDRLAPGRIRVTDACQGCGRCTAVCSSNVVVHEEVRHYGMVVDPGCMKCLDCVHSCPTNALYFGFGAPALGARGRDASGVRRPSWLPWTEDVGLALLFALAFWSFHGLNGQVPFLLALGWAAVLAFLALVAARLLYAADVKLLRWRLKQHGRLQRAGLAFAGVFVLLEGVWAHSALVQYHGARREQALRRGAWAEAERHGAFVERWSLLPDPSNGFDLAYAALRSGRPQEFESRMRALLAGDPRRFLLRYEYGNFLARSGRAAEANSQYQSALEAVARERVPAPARVELHVAYGLTLAASGRYADAEVQGGLALILAPGDPLALQLLQDLRNRAPEQD